MDIHKNARLTPLGREHMVSLVLGGQTPKAVSKAVGVCPRTVRKWVDRYQAEGLAGLQDRRSRPHRLHRPTAQAVVDRIEALRRQRLTGQAIAAETGVSPATVSRILKRLGLNRLSALEPAEPPRRYQRDRPGELIHIDVKKLGRFKHPGHRVTGLHRGYKRNYKAGWEYVHIAIDDTSRLAYLEILADEKGVTCVAFLERAVAFFADHGVTVERVMTDNGTGYRSKIHAAAIDRLGIKHLRTQPYRPRTNGKAERFIQTMLRECAYGQAFTTSQQRRRSLRRWLTYYNCRRPHSALGHNPPISRLAPAT